MLVWIHTGVALSIIEKEVAWGFRILNFLGAPDGFCINWWRIPSDRNVEPHVFPTRAEVNGGWARWGFPEVFIFRLEEWDRVLIHECIHALSWDVSIGGELKSCLEHSLGNGNVTEALFEAATELNAEWMWCIIHSPEDDTDGNTWLKQVDWQRNQAYAVLARAPAVWDEDTSVFAYYVLKAALAFEMSDFLVNWLSSKVETEKWCDLWNRYKPAFLAKANIFMASKGKMLSMRMTNPILEGNIRRKS
jgi:hypothetical protein